MRQAPGEQAGEQADDDNGQEDQSKPARILGFKIQMRQQHIVTAENIIIKKSGEEEAVRIEVYIRWVWGLDSALFESFYGMLRKNLSSSSANYST